MSAHEEDARLMPIAAIRKDGQTQHRTQIDPQVIEEYSELMRTGTVFPPVVVWWDGDTYWLADGFQRVAAAERAGIREVFAHVRYGTLHDARWDSYAANATHGVRRAAAELENIVRAALAHPNASTLSNVQLAKHLKLPETTFRRWRHKISSSEPTNRVRVLRRGVAAYSIDTTRIGRRPSAGGMKTRKQLRSELDIMKVNSTPKARRILTVIMNWMFSSALHSECMEAIEKILAE